MKCVDMKKLDNSRKRAIFKEAVKGYVQDNITDEVCEAVRASYVNYTLGLSKVYEELSKEGIEEVEIPTKHTKEPTKAQWAEYNLYRQFIYIQANLEESKRVPNNKTIKRWFKDILTIFSKNKKDKVIINSFVNKTSGIMKCSNELSLVHLQVLVETGLITSELLVGAEGGYDLMLQLNMDYKELKHTYFTTSDRNAKLVAPDLPHGQNLTSRKKYNFEHVCSEEAGDAIDWQNTTKLQLAKELDRNVLHEHIKRKLLGNDNAQDKLTEQWQLDMLQFAEMEYDIIQDNNGIFYNDRSTCGVYRMYGKSNYFSIDQGSYLRDYLEFGDKEPLTEQGIFDLKVYIAAKNGYDKCLESEAIEAFEIYEQEWRTNGDWYTKKLFNVLDNPDIPNGIMIEKDAQTQGPGIMALATHSSEGLVMTGMYTNEFRTDYYTLGCNKMNQKLGTDVWKRGALKYPFMTKGYNAQWKTIMYGSKADDELLSAEIRGKVIPLMATSDATPQATWEAFNDTMEEIAGYMMKVMRKLKKLGKQNKQSYSSFIMPDGVECIIPYQEAIKEHYSWVSSDGCLHNLTHSVFIVKPSNATTSLAPRITQAIDAYIAREVTRRCKALGIRVITNHDGYFTHINHTTKLGEIYAQVCQEIAETGLFWNIVEQCTGVRITPAKTDADLSLIGKAKYAVWY